MIGYFLLLESYAITSQNVWYCYDCDIEEELFWSINHNIVHTDGQVNLISANDACER